MELAAALEHQKTIIPVLVSDTRMPWDGDLPEELALLSRIEPFRMGNHLEENGQRERMAASTEIAGQVAPGVSAVHQ